MRDNVNTMPRIEWKWRTVAVLFMIAGLNYADRAAITAVFPLIRRELALSDLALGSIGSVFLWTYAIGSPLAGWLADRLSRSGMIFWSLVGWSVATTCAGMAHSLAALLATRALLGLAECLYLPAAVALIADYHGPQTRGTAMGIHLAGLNLGLVAGGFAAGYLGEHFGWRLNFFILGGAGLVLAVAARAVLRDVRPAAPERGENPAAGLRRIAAMLRAPAYVAVLLEAALIATGTWMFLTWLPLYFNETYRMSLAAAGFSGTFSIQIAAVVGIAGGGYLSDRVTGGGIRRRMLLMGLCECAAAPFLLAFLARPNLGLVSASIFLYSLLRSIGASNEHPIICGALAPDQRSTAIGLMNTLNCLAGGIGTLLAGYLKRDYGLSGVFAGVSALVLAAGAIVLGISVVVARAAARGQAPAPAALADSQ